MTRPGLQLIAAQTLKALHGMTIGFKDLRELWTFRSLGNLLRKFGYLALPRFDFVRRIDDLLKCRLLPHKLGFLLKIADGSIARKGNRAFIGSFLSHDDFQKRCLAGAIRTDKRPALTGVQLERCARVEDAPTE